MAKPKPKPKRVVTIEPGQVALLYLQGLELSTYKIVFIITKAENLLPSHSADIVIQAKEKT